MAEINRNQIEKTIRVVARHVRAENLPACIYYICNVWLDYLRKQDGYDHWIEYEIDSENGFINFYVYGEHGEAIKLIDCFRYY